MTRTEHIHDNECPNCMLGGPGQCDACIAREDLIAWYEKHTGAREAYEALKRELAREGA